MRSTAHIKGHPIHPMLVSFPFAYLFGTACLDAFATVTRRRALFRTARHMRALGLGSAVAAAAPGLIDYLTAVPPRSSAKTRATRHMLANLSAVTLFAAARTVQRDDRTGPPWWAVTAEVVGAGLLSVAGWWGGTLVFRNQIGVDHRYADAGQWRSTAIASDDAREETLDIGRADELRPDQMELLRVGGERIALARTEKGFAAFSDRCSHKGGPLSDGALACGVVQCPWHGSQFDVQTGEVKRGPARDSIETFDVQQRGDRLTLAPGRRIVHG